jgi:WD40 repeat protein
MVVIVLGLLSLWQWREARWNAHEAELNAQEARANAQEAELRANQALTAFSRLLLARSFELQTSQPDASLLLNLEAMRRAPAAVKEEARSALMQNLARHQPLTVDNKGVGYVDFSPNGKLLATAGADNTVLLWDVATGKQHGEPLTGHTEGVGWVEFSPDGKLLASSSADKTVRLWDVDSGKPRGVIGR